MTTFLRLDHAELAHRLRAVDPGALLVEPRVLRRVIKEAFGIPGLALQVPHRKCASLRREELLAAASRLELGLGPDEELPETVLLLSQPLPERLAAADPGEVLVRTWRLLFHLRVHAAIEVRLARPDVRAAAAVRERVRRIGQTAFDEIRSVLRQENYLLPPANDRSTYVEFAAVYLELRYFAPHLLPHYFPTALDCATVDAVLGEDVDAEALFTRTRLEGAPDPVVPVVDSGAHDGPIGVSTPAATEPTPPRSHPRAEAAAARGNLVRAALLRLRAADAAGAAADLSRLVDRLRTALELTSDEAAAWRDLLPRLLECGLQGFWNGERRLLYDLQKVCNDHENVVEVIDLVEWAVSLGNRPVRRELPALREVLVARHLRKAHHRVRAIRLAPTERGRLHHLLHEALTGAERRLRERFRPLVASVVEDEGLQPSNLPEELARGKLIEELLDDIVRHRVLNLGRLRDAFSRNQLKLPDLSGAGELAFGDPLLRADQRATVALEGVYRRGEVYMRGLQRLSSLAFGTRPGRLLTLFLLLPFCLAFLTLKGIDELVHMGVKAHAWLAGAPAPPVEEAEAALEVAAQGAEAVAAATAKAAKAPAPTFPHVTTPLSLLAVGLVILVLIHVPAVRRVCWRATRLAGWGLLALFRLPGRVLSLPLVRAVLHSRPAVWFRRHALKPLLLGATATVLGWVVAPATLWPLWSGLATCAVAALFFHSPLGRILEQELAEFLGRNWHWLRLSFFPGLVRLTLDVFRLGLEWVERFLYAVDEWLRFHRGDGRLGRVVKPALGVVWFGVTYLVRIIVNLLAEPTFNPIKHFPVVTVTHKVMLPFLVPLTLYLMEFVAPFLGKGLGGALVGAFILLLPGINGFIVWELKENWRLYRANRAATLKRVLVGSHGETVLRLLRPGFHSGTVPKLFARLRQAGRHPGRPEAAERAHQCREELHHVAESVEHFAERELLDFLRRSRSWGGLAVEVSGVHFGSNRIRIGLRCPERGSSDLWLSFDEQSGWLLAGVAEPGWLDRLTVAQRGALRLALAGFYHRAGVHLVREQLEEVFGPPVPPYDVSEEGLVLWPDPSGDSEVVYDLSGERLLTPQARHGTVLYPPLEPGRLLFSAAPLTWEAWVAAWSRDQEGKGVPDEVPATAVLPEAVDGSPSRV